MSVLRRRGLLKEASGSHIETWFDVTLSAESANINTPTASTAFVNRWNSEKPLRIFVQLYAVIPITEVVAHTARLITYENGAGIRYNLVNSSNNSGRSYNASDGTEICLEATCEYVSGQNYKITWSSNSGASGTRSSSANPFNYNITNKTYFSARNTDSTNFGVGSRLLVLAEYA